MSEIISIHSSTPAPLYNVYLYPYGLEATTKLWFAELVVSLGAYAPQAFTPHRLLDLGDSVKQRAKGDGEPYRTSISGSLQPSGRVRPASRKTSDQAKTSCSHTSTPPVTPGLL